MSAIITTNIRTSKPDISTSSSRPASAVLSQFLRVTNALNGYIEDDLADRINAAAAECPTLQYEYLELE